MVFVAMTVVQYGNVHHNLNVAIYCAALKGGYMCREGFYCEYDIAKWHSSNTFHHIIWILEDVWVAKVGCMMMIISLHIWTGWQHVICFIKHIYQLKCMKCHKITIKRDPIGQDNDKMIYLMSRNVIKKTAEFVFRAMAMKRSVLYKKD